MEDFEEVCFWQAWCSRMEDAVKMDKREGPGGGHVGAVNVHDGKGQKWAGRRPCGDEVKRLPGKSRRGHAMKVCRQEQEARVKNVPSGLLLALPPVAIQCGQHPQAWQVPKVTCNWSKYFIGGPPVTASCRKGGLPRQLVGTELVCPSPKTAHGNASFLKCSSCCSTVAVQRLMSFFFFVVVFFLSFLLILFAWA